MGLLVRFFQELELVDLKVDFKDEFAMTVAGAPQKFTFDSIMMDHQKKQNEGLICSQM